MAFSYSVLNTVLLVVVGLALSVIPALLGFEIIVSERYAIELSIPNQFAIELEIPEKHAV